MSEERTIEVPSILTSKKPTSNGTIHVSARGGDDTMIYLTAMVMYRNEQAYECDGPVVVNTDHIQYIFLIKNKERVTTMVSMADGMELEVSETQKQVTDAVARARKLKNACLCGPAKKE